MIAAPTLMLFLAAASQAATPCPERAERRLSPCLPSQPERAELAGLIKSAMVEYARYEAARVKEGRLRALYFLEEQPRDAATDAARLAKLAEWQAELGRLKDIESKMKDSFKLAAAETARRYGVSPRTEGTHVAGGILRGAAASWSPTMQEAKDGYFYSQREVGVLPFGRDKKAAYLKYESIDRGDPADEKDDWERQSETLDDGSVLISLRLFRMAQNANDGKGDPAILAAHLAMERARFEKKTCAGTAVGCSLQRGSDDLKRELVEMHGIRETLAAADAIGLNPDYKVKLEGRLARLDHIRKEAEDGRGSLSAAFGSVDDSKSNMAEWGNFQAQLRGIRRQQGQLSRRLEARRRGEPEEPFLRDALNDRRPPEGATTDDGCGIQGFWAGDVYIPPAPCARALPPPPNNEAIPATPALPTPAIPAVPAAPVRPIFSLYDLAARICKDPSAAHSQLSHDDFRTGWWTAALDDSSLEKCQREVFLVFKKLRQEGYSDYNSAYFQSLAENLNSPQAPVFVPPEPDFDTPVRPGPETRDCVLVDGRRCIRWR